MEKNWIYSVSFDNVRGAFMSFDTFLVVKLGHIVTEVDSLKAQLLLSIS